MVPKPLLSRPPNHLCFESIVLLYKPKETSLPLPMYCGCGTSLSLSLSARPLVTWAALCADTTHRVPRPRVGFALLVILFFYRRGCAKPPWGVLPPTLGTTEIKAHSTICLNIKAVWFKPTLSLISLHFTACYFSNRTPRVHQLFYTQTNAALSTGAEAYSLV